MPTVILLDVSLSMCRLSLRQAPNKDSELPSQHEPVEVRQLANVGIGTLLDYLAQNAHLEHTSLVIFSSLWEIRNQFTRNHESIKSGIYELDLYDKSNIVNAIRGVNSMKLSEWSQSGVVNIVLLTDGQYYATRLASAHGDDFRDIPLEELEGQFDFPCKIQVVCLCSPRDAIFRHNLGFFKKLVATIDSTCGDCPVIVGTNVKNPPSSAIWLPEPSSYDASVHSVESLFNKIAEVHYKPYHSVLSFGHLSSMVLLSPSPMEYAVKSTKQSDHMKISDHGQDVDRRLVFEHVDKVQTYTLNEELSICGFMSADEIASPAVTSRHLVMPIPNSKFNETSKAHQILSQDPNAYNKSLQTCAMSGPLMNVKTSASPSKPTTQSTRSGSKSNSDNALEQDLTKQPSFCVLLHNCLKQENTIAICIVGKNAESNEDWFGIVHPHVDARKRSNLMLSLLLPGPNPIPWLSNFRSLGSASLSLGLTPTIPANTRPVAKSYSSNNVIWLDPESVQADVQKIVRHAKRGIDKAPHFYKELNRIRRAAISYGFYDVLTGLAAILEREKALLQSDENRPGNKEIAANIEQVIVSLRSDLNEESYETRLIPSV